MEAVKNIELNNELYFIIFVFIVFLLSILKSRYKDLSKMFFLSTFDKKSSAKFLKKDNSYEIYVTSDNVDDNIIYNIDPNANILKWKPNNNYRALIFRIIDFSKFGITNSTGPLTPDETQKMMSKFYPKITIIT